MPRTLVVDNLIFVEVMTLVRLATSQYQASTQTHVKYGVARG